MATFTYQALTGKGEIVRGSIDAPDVAEVARRIEYLGLVPIEMRAGRTEGGLSWARLMTRPATTADVTLFTRDLALVLSAGVRLEDALDLVAADRSLGRLQAVVGSIRSSVLSGETFAAALGHHRGLFPPIYVSLIRVAEMSGTLTGVLQALADERTRTAELKRKVRDALSYPGFVLGAAVLVVGFFVGFVLPQFGTVLQDSGAKVDPIIVALLGLSGVLRGNADVLALLAAAVVMGMWLLLRQAAVRHRMLEAALRLPGLKGFATGYRTALFCRTLGVLLGSGVPLSAALRMLAETMAAAGSDAIWSKVAERVRQGSRLADAISAVDGLPPTAIRMLRLGEETGQLAPLALKTAELFETKLERGLAGVVGIIGPAAIIAISAIVGGLIVSIMTSLLSITQLVN